MDSGLFDVGLSSNQAEKFLEDQLPILCPDNSLGSPSKNDNNRCNFP